MLSFDPLSRRMKIFRSGKLMFGHCKSISSAMRSPWRNAIKIMVLSRCPCLPSLAAAFMN